MADLEKARPFGARMIPSSDRDGRDGLLIVVAARFALPVQHDEHSVLHPRLAVTANREIVLQCGEGSLKMTPAGKIILRGSYVLSCSSGVNQMKGGSVQIN